MRVTASSCIDEAVAHRYELPRSGVSRCGVAELSVRVCVCVHGEERGAQATQAKGADLDREPRVHLFAMIANSLLSTPSQACNSQEVRNS
eukprot:4437436-Pleurochrysis_carterae.AAC.2